MKKYLLPIALFLGVTWDILFWKHVPGISFPIFVAMCLIAGALLLRSEKYSFSRKSVLLLMLVLFFSIMSAVRKDPLTTALNYSLALFFFFLLSATYQNGLWVSYSLFDYLINSFKLFGDMFYLPWKFLAELTSKKDQKAKKQKNSKVWQIVRGLLLALPILFIFTQLFSSADLIFSQKIQDIFALLRIENLGEFIARGTIVFFIAYFYIGMIRNAVERSGNKALIGLEKPFIKSFLGITETSIVLGSVILLFTAFVFIQFRYLFSGEIAINPSGFTYAEYARRGFGELVAVAFISMLMIQSLRASLKHENTNQRKLFAWMVIGLVGLVLVILASAFQRLSLYESAYGFSSLRTYAHVFIIWLGLLLLGVVFLEIKQKPRAFANMSLAVVVGFAVTLNFMNVDAFIVRENYERTLSGAELDASYLGALSSDAVPALVKTFQSSSQQDETWERVGAALACQQLGIEQELHTRNSWQSFHFSNWYASRQISRIQEQLDIFRINKGEFSLEVISPRGMIISCHYAPFLD